MLRIRFPNYVGLLMLRLSRYQSSDVSSIRNVLDEKKLLYQFPNPAGVLHNVIKEVCAKLQSPLYKPKVTMNKVSEGVEGPRWQAKLTLIWPEHITVEGTAKRKEDAEKLACLLACQKMKEMGKLDEGNRPILPETDIIVKGIKIKEAKSALANMFARIGSILESDSYKPVYNTLQIKDKHGVHGWKSEVTLHWPETFTVKATGMRKSQAEASAAAKAIHWLHQKQMLDKNNYPILYSRKDRLQLFHNRWSPYPICIPEEIQNKMESLLAKYEKLKGDIEQLKSMCNLNEKHLDLSPNMNNSLPDLDFFEEDSFQPPMQASQTLIDVITGRPYQKAKDHYLVDRSHSMYCMLNQHRQSQDPVHIKIKKLQESLPITEKRDQILHLIENNQVVVLSGETGCGKTTQVPQFILDNFIMKLKGAFCNMVITQPRRISAISISERVAHERGEELGENFGYQVRLKKEIPKEKGAVLFCSTGVLLQRLQSNPLLEGISHVIVDEVHERDIQTDFLLVLLKNIIEKNKKIRIILMSASMNAEMFSHYFQNCPIIHVPGTIQPVREYYLPEIVKLIQDRGREEEVMNRPLVNYNRILKLIKYIDSNKPPGAILCFLPGWQEIKTVMFELRDLFRNDSHYRIIPVHSRLPAHEQKLMFETAPPQIRKIVLATNVAETSITINDVVYVINPGCHREMTYDAERGVATLSTNWISRANARQRKGRAGRVQPGECYHLFTKNTLAKMDEFPSPEMHRVPLEKVVLDCKLYCQNTPVQEFLSKAPQPPPQDAVSNAIQYLKVLGVMDSSEQLTLLGKHIAPFTTHPSLSKALVYGTFLRCVDPVLTISAILTANRDPFTVSMENRSHVKEIKKKYDSSTFSDHFALCCLYNDWLSEHIEGRSEERSFCSSNSINFNTMTFVKGLKTVFGNHLCSTGMLENSLYYENYELKENENSNDSIMIIAALCAALYPNIIKMTRGIMDRGRIKKDEIRCLTLCGQSASIQKDSIVAKEKILPSPWLSYFYGVRSAERRQLLVRDVSVIPAVALILFAGQKLHMQMEWNADEAILVIDSEKKLSFSCSKQEAELLVDWRKCLQEIFQCFLECSGKINSGEEFSNIESLKSSAFSILMQLLTTPQKQFTPSENVKCNLERSECSSLCI